HQGIAHSLTSAAPTLIDDGPRVSCTPIVIGGAVAGAVLVGADDSQRLGDRELARAGSLIANAIEDEFARPSREAGGSLHKISAFYQLLHAAIASGSDREVVRTFAEAVSVWDDIE